MIAAGGRLHCPSAHRLDSSGTAVGIGMKFGPSGCATAKERLHLCLSLCVGGADPNDALTRVVHTFEVTGMSYVPAFVSEDVYSISEGQEVVASLADSTDENSAKGGVTLQKVQGSVLSPTIRGFGGCLY